MNEKVTKLQTPAGLPEHPFRMRRKAGRVQLWQQEGWTRNRKAGGSLMVEEA